MHQDSERLSVGAVALVTYVNGSGQAEETGIATLKEELEAWLAGHGWPLPDVESGTPSALDADIAGLASRPARVLARASVGRAAQDARFAARSVRRGPRKAARRPGVACRNLWNRHPDRVSQDSHAAWRARRSGDLRQLGNFGISQTGRWVCPAALWCGLPAVAVVHGVVAANSSLVGANTNFRIRRAQFRRTRVLPAPLSRRLRRA